jgi:hypothetical protein
MAEIGHSQIQNRPPVLNGAIVLFDRGPFDAARQSSCGRREGERKRPPAEGGLCRRDKTLGAPAFRAFIDVMHKTRLFLLDTRKPHPPTAFEANGLLVERLRSGLRFHELLSAKASQGSMTGWLTPILGEPAAASRAGEPCAGADCPRPDRPPTGTASNERGRQLRRPTCPALRFCRLPC